MVEEFPIKSNRLIDGDGVWCYQIPMNLDYIGTDEFGNIIPVQDSKKGIPTRTSVRFRISLQETITLTSTEHVAKYLVPNKLHKVFILASKMFNHQVQQVINAIAIKLVIFMNHATFQH